VLLNDAGILALLGVQAPENPLVVPSRCTAQGISVLDSACKCKFSVQILATFFLAQDCISPVCAHTPFSAPFVAQLIMTVFICGSPGAG